MNLVLDVLGEEAPSSKKCFGSSSSGGGRAGGEGVAKKCWCFGSSGGTTAPEGDDLFEEVVEERGWHVNLRGGRWSVLSGASTSGGSRRRREMVLGDPHAGIIIGHLEVIIDWGPDTLGYELDKDRFWQLVGRSGAGQVESRGFLFAPATSEENSVPVDAGVGENSKLLRDGNYAENSETKRNEQAHNAASSSAPAVHLSPENLQLNLAVRHANQGVGYIVGFLDCSCTTTRRGNKPLTPPRHIGHTKHVKLGVISVNADFNTIKKHQVNVRFLHPNEGRSPPPDDAVASLSPSGSRTACCGLRVMRPGPALMRINIVILLNV